MKKSMWLYSVLCVLVCFKTSNAQGPKTHTNSIGMEFVYIPDGSFMMGAPPGEGRDIERPQHKVTISGGFYMGKYEVTQSEWQAVMGNNPSYFKGADLPVETVSYYDILQFIIRLNTTEDVKVYRLPTEAEWEYACRAGSTTRYYFGNNASVDSLGKYGWYGANSAQTTHPVGQKLPNAWGLYDTIGNLWEWCSDWFGGDYYSQSPPIDPQGPAIGTRGILRGGDWVSPADHGYSYIRGVDPPPAENREDIGFRLVRIAR